MAKQTPEMSKSEWLIMDWLWRASRATATEVQAALESSQGWAYSTVKTMLDRLVDKGFVKARRVGNVYEYSPKIKRPAAVRRVVDEVAERLFDGSVAPFIQCLIEQKKLTSQEAQQLRSLLDNYAEQEEE